MKAWKKILEGSFPELSLDEHIERGMGSYVTTLIARRCMDNAVRNVNPRCPGCGTHEKIVTQAENVRFCTTCQEIVQ